MHFLLVCLIIDAFHFMHEEIEDQILVMKMGSKHGIEKLMEYQADVVLVP